MQLSARFAPLLRKEPQTMLLYIHYKSVLNLRINNVNWHIGNNFSIDTIFAQFSHIDEIVGMGCNVVEMETVAAFETASVAGIPMVALFRVSDNTVTQQSLVSGGTEKNMEYRQFVRRELFPRIILEIYLIIRKIRDVICKKNSILLQYNQVKHERKRSVRSGINIYEPVFVR